MLPRQPLRFLLADDPGAGKTIMAGLLMKELIARADLQRCLVVCPGNLAEQWQDELYRRFHLPFEILTNDKLEAARTGNWFLETNLVIARLDKLSRNEEVQQKLQTPDCRWELIVCDEAHKMSAHCFGGEINYTKRYRLGQLLSTLTRHFLLMTATPHNGKEEDCQLFMALLDGDRFEGRFRDGTHVADVSDLMRRMVKENLLKFDGTRLFPERIACTVPYRLSNAEAQLYKAVTDYVRNEFNRAEALQNDKRAGTIGFALTILQRRLASSPEAIYQSLRRRRERLESRQRELELLQRGAGSVGVGTEPRVLFYLEHAVQDASLTRAGERRIVSKRMLYIEIEATGKTHHLHYAPYLDYRPLEGDEPDLAAILDRPECQWIGHELEQTAQGYAVAHVVPEHLAEVRGRKLALVAETEAAVKDRLTKEISYWDHRAEELKLQEQAGKPNARLNSDEARRRADALQVRLEKRMTELKLEAQRSPLPPVVLGGLLVVPMGLLAAMTGRAVTKLAAFVET